MTALRAEAELAAKVAAAKFYREKIKKLLDLVGATTELPCQSCGRRIRFITTKKGKFMPITVDGVSHFADCPNASVHRNPR